MFGIGRPAGGGGLRALNLIVFFKSLLWAVTFFFLPLMLAGMGMNGAEIGILFSIMTAMTILVTFPTGMLNDRLSIRSLIITGMLLTSAYFALLSSLSGFWLMVPVFIIGGLGSTLMDTSTVNMVFKKLVDARKGRSFGLYQLAGSCGAGLGVAVGGFMLAGTPFGIVLMATSALFFLLFLASFRLSETDKASFPLLMYKQLLMRKKVLLLLIPLIMFSMHWGAESTSYSLFLKDYLGLGTIASGLYMGLPMIVLGAFACLSGISIDRRKNGKAVFYAGLMLCGLGHLLMAVPSLYASFFFRIIHEIGDAAVVVSYSVAFSTMFPKETVAGNSGMMKVVMIIGSIAGSLVFGPLGYAYGYQWPFIASGIIALASGVMLVAFRNMPGLRGSLG